MVDLFITNDVLYQLSYIGENSARKRNLHPILFLDFWQKRRGDRAVRPLLHLRIFSQGFESFLDSGHELGRENDR